MAEERHITFDVRLHYNVPGDMTVEEVEDLLDCTVSQLTDQAVPTQGETFRIMNAQFLGQDVVPCP